MLTSILYSLDQIALIVGAVFIFVKSLFSRPDSKSDLKIAEIFVVISLVSSVIFYNKGIFPIYFETSVYTTISYVFTAFMVLMCFKFCRSWTDIGQNLNISLYAVLALIALVALNIIIKTHHLQILLGGIFILGISELFLLYLDRSNESLHRFGRNFGSAFILVVLIFALSLFYLTDKQFDYNEAAGSISLLTGFKQTLLITAIFCPIFFMLGVAPFHFWKTDHIASLCLPVSCFLALVPMIGIYTSLLKLNSAFFVFFEQDLRKVYFFFGVISILIAVIGINSSRFLNKIFSYCGLYALANALLVLSVLKQDSSLITFIYIEFYLLFTLGIYACFYTLKSNGVFLNHVALISGLSKTKPYIAAFITFFILNFMALPPLTGMLSELIVLKEVTTKPVILYLCLFALLAMMPAFFKILQTIYFKQKENAFDRVDMRLYFYLFCIAGICILALFKPELFFSQLYLLSVK